jgi:hypothetical protein
MMQFMMHATFHQQDRQNIMALVPQERERIKVSSLSAFASNKQEAARQVM